MNILEVTNLCKQYPAVGKAAINNISFALKKGGRLGIIGKNGSGKSTLLKILSGFVKPTDGKIVINGSINSILDIGEHFVNDLTGEENARLFLSLKGVDNSQINNFIKNIKDFSELDNFFEHPIKTYSNGMKLRLGIACSIEVQSDLLIIDEVFSAGDAQFKLKVNEYLKKKMNAEMSIVFVSHNPEEILENCTECLWLENGNIKEKGDAKEIVESYYLSLAKEKSERDYLLAFSQKNDANFFFKPKENELLAVTQFYIKGENLNEPVTFDKPIVFTVEFTKKSSEVTLHSQIVIFDYQMKPIMLLNQQPGSPYDNRIKEFKSSKGKYVYSVVLPAYMLTFGNYYAELKFGKNLSSENMHNQEAMKLEKIHFKIEKGSARDWSGANEQVFVKPMCHWEITALNQEKA